MADFTLKQHDRLPPIQAVLKSGNPPAAVDLTTAASVKFIMATSTVGGTIKVNAAATIVDAVTGVVRYDWAALDTATVGTFVAEWQVTWSSGTKQQTFPTTSYHSIEIVSDLDGA
jgi:hypothetical protein